MLLKGGLLLQPLETAHIILYYTQVFKWGAWKDKVRIEWLYSILLKIQQNDKRWLIHLPLLCVKWKSKWSIYLSIFTLFCVLYLLFLGIKVKCLNCFSYKMDNLPISFIELNILSIKSNDKKLDFKLMEKNIHESLNSLLVILISNSSL